MRRRQLSLNLSFKATDSHAHYSREMSTSAGRRPGPASIPAGAPAPPARSSSTCDISAAAAAIHQVTCQLCTLMSPTQPVHAAN